MPLRKGTSPATVSQNFDEVRHGKTYAKTRKKFGKKRANKQMIAIVLSEKRRSKRASKR